MDIPTWKRLKFLPAALGHVPSDPVPQVGEGLSLRGILKAALLGALAVGAPSWLALQYASRRNDAAGRGSWPLEQGGLRGAFLSPAAAPAARFAPPPKNVWQPPPLTHVDCLPQAGSPACAAPMSPARPLAGDLAICLMIQDELDFAEWLHYHRRLGVGAFYIFDHNSTLPLPQRMPVAELDRGDVYYQYINHFPNTTDMNHQMSVYSDCLELGKHHPWMAFIDADEYLVPAAGHVYLPDFLRQFQGQCALILNWRIMGSSNHTTRPAGSVLENYTRCAPKRTPLGHQTKIIANPLLLDDFVGRGTIQGPHLVFCRNQTNMVTEDNEIFEDMTPTTVPMEKLEVYHFIIKSKEEFSQKVVRGGGTGDKRDMSFFDEVDDLMSEDCFAGRDLARALG
jgi:hypothetical protein